MQGGGRRRTLTAIFITDYVIAAAVMATMGIASYMRPGWPDRTKIGR